MRKAYGVTAVLICLGFALSVVGHCAVVRVSTDGEDSPSHDGSTWALAKKTVQAGIDAAVSGDEVWVAAGTYAQCITLGTGVGLYGGFAGTETERSQRNWTANVTILDGNKAGSVVVSPDAATPTTVIDGFAIRKGQTNSNGGGGIYCANGSPTISNNTIRGNMAYRYGGGICCSTGSPAISNNTISDNTATLGSGGYGGGIYCNGSPTISNNTVSGNTAYGEYVGYGGGIYCSNGSPTISNNTISGNSASSYPGGYGGYGGGIYCGTGGSLVNNIVAFNSSGVYAPLGSILVEHNNCVYNPAGSNYDGISAGTGDISADPLFVDASSGNYHLGIGSPCIDAGDNSVVQQGWTDRDGNPRVFPTGGVVDMGCYESDRFGITITSPTTNYVYYSTVSLLAISGTTTDNLGNVTGVTWSNNMGGSGSCSGTAAWSADDIVLQPGTNIITVTAVDDLGNTTKVVLTVYYYPVPPTVTITNPTSEPAYATTDSTINLLGTAASYFGVAGVSWSNSRGGSGACVGTTSWSVNDIILQPGDNVITVKSTDGAGNSVSASITVTRNPISIGSARQRPAGNSVFASAVVTATNIEAGSVFVESPDRSSGIKLVTSQSLSVGQSVQFTGTTGRVNGEYQISNVTFQDIATATPLAPLGMISKTMGNDRTEQLNYMGMNTTGLLIRYAGKVVMKSTTERFVYVDDGGSFEDGLSAYFLGIRVYIPAGVTIPDKNRIVAMTGILRPEKHILPSGGGEVNGDWYPEGTTIYIPSIWIRNSSDISVIK